MQLQTRFPVGNRVWVSLFSTASSPQFNSWVPPRLVAFGASRGERGSSPGRGASSHATSNPVSSRKPGLGFALLDRLESPIQQLGSTPSRRLRRLAGRTGFESWPRSLLTCNFKPGFQSETGLGFRFSRPPRVPNSTAGFHPVSSPSAPRGANGVRVLAEERPDMQLQTRFPVGNRVWVSLVQLSALTRLARSQHVARPARGGPAAEPTRDGRYRRRGR